MIIKMNLGFFEGGEKTEQPTARKKTKAREEGQVAKSPEISTAALFLGIFFTLRFVAPSMISGMIEVFYTGLTRAQDANMIFTKPYITRLIFELFAKVLLIVMPIFVVALVSGLIVSFIQVGWHPTLKPLKPKFSKLNPLSGFKRLFSFSKLVDLAKALLKFSIIVIAIYMTLKKQMDQIPLLLDMGLVQAMAYIANTAIDLGLLVGWMYVFIAAVDYVYTRFKHTKQLKMTKQEVKEEYKSIEGNPQVKGKIKQKMREISMRRMMHDVPSADVIITNPTHIAVALRYDKESPRAPVVVAKGVDFLAKKIKEKAKEAGVEIVENKPLARTLYTTVDIGREIPPDLYQAVAEILAFVYKLKNKAV